MRITWQKHLGDEEVWYTDTKKEDTSTYNRKRQLKSSWTYNEENMIKKEDIEEN